MGETQLKYYYEHREERIQKMKEWHKRTQYNKKYYLENKEKIEKYKKNHKEQAYKSMKKYHNRIYKENIDFLIKQNILTNCVICGFPKEKFASIDFHHVNPEEKEKNISSILQHPDKENLLKETSKCVCMCRNCHNLYHTGDEEITEKYNKYIKRRNKNVN